MVVSVLVTCKLRESAMMLVLLGCNLLHFGHYCINTSLYCYVLMSWRPKEGQQTEYNKKYQMSKAFDNRASKK